MAHLMQLEPFEFELGAGSTNAENWKDWKRGFNIYLKACKIEDDEVQVATLLHVVGRKAERIYNVSSDAAHKVADVLKILDNYFLKDLVLSNQRKNTTSI